MAEPGRFSLEWLVSDLPARWATLLAAIVAVAIAVFFSRETLQKTSELFEANYGYDAQLRRTVSNRSLSTNGLPVTFVDIDDAAIGSWGDASRTMPRKKLAEIVSFVAAKHPSVIFLDFDLSGVSANDGDPAMRDFLASYPPQAPPLLITTEIKQVECPGGICGSDECESEPGVNPDLVETSESPFTKVVADKPNIHWVSSVFFPDGDGVVRSWRLWEYVCRDHHVRALPSAQLAAAGLATEKDDGPMRLKSYLHWIDSPSSGLNASAWPANRDARETLIPFMIGASPTSEVSDWSGGKFRYERVRAESVLADQVADSVYKGRVIVIGASYGPDKLGTPFGRMPGAALMSNAIAVAPPVLANASRPFLTTFLTLILATIYAVLAKALRAIPAAVLILVLSTVWLSIATAFLNPADSVNTVSSALVVLAAFLALESVFEIAFDLFEGKGLAAFMRHKAGGH